MSIVNLVNEIMKNYSEEFLIIYIIKYNIYYNNDKAEKYVQNHRNNFY